MKNIFSLVAALVLCVACGNKTTSIYVEAESFEDKGGWSVDQQFTFEMGSPYLIAHGMGEAVADASTEVSFKQPGVYHIYVRTFNWTSRWSDKRGPGLFRIGVGDELLEAELGVTGEEWEWQYAGQVNIEHRGRKRVWLHDESGFDGRCDAIYFTLDGSVPPASVATLAVFRDYQSSPKIKSVKYDFVVVGGGISGMCAAVAAARLGTKVALINDRPLWGGNNSSETRVHLGGHIEMEPYPNLGNVIKEFGPTRGGNARPAEYYEDEKKEHFLEEERNLSLYPSYRAYAVDKSGDKITAIYAEHIETGERLRFVAPVYSDCTGDGTIGYLAGADYAMGRESRSDYGEPSAPEKGDKMTMGSSVQWYSVEESAQSDFPLFEYGLDFNEESCQRVTMGEWTWETGMNYNQCEEFERIRDYGLMVVYSNWSFLKNRLTDNEQYKNRKLGWVAYIAGKRESRRLLGDHVLTENDLINDVIYSDASFTTTWSIDLHYPDPQNSAYFPGQEFKSICVHGKTNPYAVPYRCLYSRNVGNLFMAGRDISVTHIGLGTVRVMRTCGMMGEVVGMAASLCCEHKTTPRDIYLHHFDEMKALMRRGVGEPDMENNQLYNLGGNWPSYRKK
ncbi:MAG: FAD-dependent oxidoreductase [Alistipes sp.]|nr:FAD-dependent oxidoreductase [Alistipes sp.]